MGKTLSGDKSLSLEPSTRFYATENGDDTEEGEEAEILVIYDSSLASYKKNLVKRKFPYIDTFNHERPTVVGVMRDRNVVVFEHLYITYPMDSYKRIA